jgi:hypothetical protein
MRTIINRNTSTDIRGNCQGRIVVTAVDVVRTVMLAQPVFGQFFQAMAAKCAKRLRALAAAAARMAHAAESMLDLLDSSLRGPSGHWHSHYAMPVQPVVVVKSVG